MIVNAHPVLEQLAAAPFTFHLIGSRYVGKFSDASDYDFLGVAKDYGEWTVMQKWLTGHGFKVQHPNEYGPDKRLYSGDVWTWRGDGKHPPVDVLPVDPKEAAFRLRWLAAMKSVGDKSGLIAKGLKAEKAWPLLWDVLEKFAVTP